MQAGTLVCFAVIVLLCAELLFFIYLEVINRPFLAARGRILSDWLRPAFDEAIAGRSVDYALTRSRFRTWSQGASTAATVLCIVLGLFGVLDRWVSDAVGAVGPGQIITGVMYVWAWMIVAAVFSLPFSYYSTFVIEGRFGFNKSTVARWVKDQVLGLAVGLVLVGALCSALLAVMQYGGPLWWIWATAVTLAFAIAAQLLFPTVIAPLFNRFRPLGDVELGRQVEEMCSRLEFPVAGVYEIDASTRSTKSNAYVAGLGRVKRIALFDTLVQLLTPREILAVLAYEIGHSKHGHLAKGLVSSIPQIVFFFVALELARRYPPFFAAFGASPSDYMALVLVKVALSPVLFFLSLAAAWLSRRFEFEADLFAARALGDPEPLVSGLVKLCESSLTSPSVHPMYAAFYDSHPRIVRRVEVLRATFVSQERVSL
jgi:STE24 endopeptidase